MKTLLTTVLLVVLLLALHVSLQTGMAYLDVLESFVQAAVDLARLIV